MKKIEMLKIMLLDLTASIGFVNQRITKEGKKENFCCLS